VVNKELATVKAAAIVFQQGSLLLGEARAVTMVGVSIGKGSRRARTGSSSGGGVVDMRGLLFLGGMQVLLGSEVVCSSLQICCVQFVLIVHSIQPVIKIRDTCELGVGLGAKTKTQVHES
jgi:hypothetical protein